MNDNSLNNQNSQIPNQASSSSGVQDSSFGMQSKQQNFNSNVNQDPAALNVNTDSKTAGEVQGQSQASTTKSDSKTRSDMPIAKKTGESIDPSGSNSVTKRDVENVVASWTGIPISKLTEDESAKLLELEKRVHKRLIDQEEAVVKVSEAVRRGRIGLASGQRPIASFIFLGPSGTGKTELAKTLAEILFGRDDAMIRLDMSEYMEKHEVAKIIGAPPGYVGYEEGGQLTEAVRAKPYSIVLLDEVEKAHPDVFNILLQLLEDGRLTDNKGNVISFKNTIIICTSNIGSGLITEKLKEGDTKTEKSQAQYQKEFVELSSVVNNELRKFFRPELLNRFDDIVIFKPLRREDMVGIAKLGVEKTAKLLKEQGYSISVTDRALNKLAREGYDPMYGARPLRRLIQNSLENPIALEIIGKKFVPGDNILIDYKGDTNAFSFTKGERTSEENVGDKSALNDGSGQQKQTGSNEIANPAQNTQAPIPTTQNLENPEVQAVQPSQQMFYGQQLPQNTIGLNPQAPRNTSTVTNFDPMSVLGSDNNSGTPNPLETPSVYPPSPPSTGAYVGSADSMVNTNNFQQGAVNETVSQSVLSQGQLTNSGLEVLNEEF